MGHGVHSRGTVEVGPASTDSEKRLLQPAMGGWVGVRGSEGSASPQTLPCGSLQTLSSLVHIRQSRPHRAGETVALASEVTRHPAGSDLEFHFWLSLPRGCKNEEVPLASIEVLIFCAGLEPRI